MKVAVACDHAGYELKKLAAGYIRKHRHTVLDLGTHNRRPVDYPDYAFAVARAIREGRAERGVLICGSGVGASVAANKIIGIRAGLCHDVYSARQGVEHDDVNVLCIGARVVGSELALELIAAFLKARFTGEARHQRRIDKILKLERGETLTR